MRIYFILLDYNISVMAELNCTQTRASTRDAKHWAYLKAIDFTLKIILKINVIYKSYKVFVSEKLNLDLLLLPSKSSI